MNPVPRDYALGVTGPDTGHRRYHPSDDGRMIRGYTAPRARWNVWSKLYQACTPDCGQVVYVCVRWERDATKREWGDVILWAKRGRVVFAYVSGVSPQDAGPRVWNRMAHLMRRAGLRDVTWDDVLTAAGADTSEASR